MEFDGVGDMLKIEGYKGIAGFLPRTCCAWIKTTIAPGNILWWGNNTDLGGMWDMKLNGVGQLRLQVRGGFISGNTVLTTGEWIHIAAVLPSGAICVR